MSSAVYQGLQSCLEPRLVEPRSLGLKMVATNPSFLRPGRPPRMLDSDSYMEEANNDNNNNNSNTTNDDVCARKSKDSDNDKRKKDTTTKLNGDLGGWSFIQSSLPNNPNSSSMGGLVKEKLYVHPFIKQSSSMKLSEKSLEFCTENLGCETGSTTSEDIDYLSSTPSSPSSSSSDSETCKSPTRERMSRQVSMHRRANCQSFPPPLKSISGSNCVNISSHREDGRLVLKAALLPSSHTYFQSERRDGRLILRFLENSSSSSTSFHSKLAAKVDVEEEEEEKQVVDSAVEEGDMDGINSSVGGEIGMRKLQRPSRCMEGGDKQRVVALGASTFGCYFLKPLLAVIET